MEQHSLRNPSPHPFTVLVEHPAVSQQRMVDDPEEALHALRELLRQAPDDAHGAWGVTADWPGTISLITRYRQGILGETRRVAHIIPMHPGTWHGCTLTSWCRTQLYVPDLEFLTPGQGMPCLGCIRRAPLQHGAPLEHRREEQHP